MAKQVGIIKKIYRYPVKGMRGESLQQALVGWNGIEGDRRFAFLHPDRLSGFPWMTGRLKPSLIRYIPQFEHPANLDKSAVLVQTPSGDLLDIKCSQMLAEIRGLFGDGVVMLKMSRGCFDTMPISLISTNTLASISEGLDLDLSARRFRPNLVIEPNSADYSPEDNWLEHSIQIGEGDAAVKIRGDRQNVRCKMISLDPDTAVPNPAVLKKVNQTRGGKAGIYATAINV
ncbi:MAG: MOSC domain-containing protein, partial [Chloroflexota bacterium]